MFYFQEIVSNPRFFIDGSKADDLSQGSLGNCWFVAACACIAERKNLLRKVFHKPAGGSKYLDMKCVD